MSTSETITKADLTNILNKVLPIRSETPCNTVTLPFTPTANGLMIVLIRNTSSARAYQSFTNTLPTLVDNYAVADGYWSQIVYVQKGKQVALSTQSNIKTVVYYYIPLDDIASAISGGVQIKRFSKSATFSGQSYVDIDLSLPSGATIQSVNITQAPNPNWITCGISAYGTTSVRVSYHNTYSSAITGTIEVAVFYTT